MSLQNGDIAIGLKVPLNLLYKTSLTLRTLVKRLYLGIQGAKHNDSLGGKKDVNISLCSIVLYMYSRSKHRFYNLFYISDLGLGSRSVFWPLLQL